MTSVTTDRRQGVNSGAAIKVPVKAASTANITLNGLQTVDGVVLASGDRVLVTSQTDATENGIYEADTGNWTRTLDWDGTFDIVCGTLIFITQGNSYGNCWFTVSSQDPITIGTTAITFNVQQISASVTALVLDSIAALKALAAPTSAITVLVRGFAAAGDGGGGFYWWNAADASADNGGTIIAINAGGAGRFNKLF